MKTKTARLLVILFVITICLSFGTVALADESISTSVRVNPPSLPGPGTVSVVVTIKNDGDPISDVRLKYPSPTDTEVTIGDIGTDETKEHVNENWNITEDMFDKDLAFTVTWTSLDGSVKSGQTPAIVITQQAETVDVVGEASADPTEIEAGERVKFRFSMQNKGNVTVENAYLNAPPIEDGNQIGSNFALAPGETKNMEYTITVNESMTVNPVFTYDVNGEQQTLTLNAVSVNVDQPANVTMNMTLQASQTMTTQGGDVDFTVTVSNTGNSQLDGLQVKDFNGNAVEMSNTTLQPGAEVTGSVTLPITQTGNYSFTGTAVGAGGQSLNIQSNNVAITLEGDETPAPETTDTDTNGVDASKIIRTDISLSTTQLSKPGEVDMTVIVTNLTQDALSNIVVLDERIGTIGTEGSLAGGESVTFEKAFTAEETAAYEFVTTAQLPDGSAVESSVGTTITVEQNSGGLESWQMGLIIVGAAIAAVVIILIMYTRKMRAGRGSRQAQSRRANPQDPHDRRYSASGRERPQRYSNGSYEPDYDRRPERPSAAQQQEYQKKRGSRVETIDPNKARASYAEQQQRKPAAKNTQTNTNRQQPRSNRSSSARFGDRNKF